MTDETTSAPERRPGPPVYGTVLCLGDSLTFGARSNEGGPPEFLEDLLNERMRATGDETEWACINAGVSGQTSLEIRRRAPPLVQSLGRTPGARWLVLLLGTNDSKAGGGAIGTLDVSLARWEANVRSVLRWAVREELAIALCTLPPVDPRKMPAFAGAEPWIARANDRLRALAAEYDNRPRPVALVELSDLPRQMLADGVHLKPAGCREVARRLCDALAGPDPFALAASEEPETVPAPDAGPEPELEPVPEASPPARLRPERPVRRETTLASFGGQEPVTVIRRPRPGPPETPSSLKER